MMAKYLVLKQYGLEGLLNFAIVEKSSYTMLKHLNIKKPGFVNLVYYVQSVKDLVI